MFEIILDTETTGLSTTEKHRIVEIGCLEFNDRIPTKRIFQCYLNPERTVSEDAFKIHGYSNEFLADKKIPLTNKDFTDIFSSLVSRT